MRGWRLGALSWLITFTAVQWAFAAEPQPRITVENKVDGLSVEARNVTLPDLLRAVGDKVGFTVVDKAGPRSVIPSFSFHGAGIEKMLSALLANENFGIIYGLAPDRRDNHVVNQVILLGRLPEVSRSQSNVQRTTALNPLEQDPSAANQTPSDSLEAAGRRYEGAVAQARVLVQEWENSMKQQAGAASQTPSDSLEAARRRYEGAAAQARALLQKWENSMKEQGVR